MMKVYIASPYTKGDVAVNVKKQIDVANSLISYGFCPFTPLMYHFQHIVHPLSYKEWVTLGIEWLKCCDVVLRLPGESTGADYEVQVANCHSIPVVYSIAELIAYQLSKR